MLRLAEEYLDLFSAFEPRFAMNVRQSTTGRTRKPGSPSARGPSSGR
jgi:hypothetical protein